MPVSTECAAALLSFRYPSLGIYKKTKKPKKTTAKQISKQNKTKKKKKGRREKFAC